MSARSNEPMSFGEGELLVTVGIVWVAVLAAVDVHPLAGVAIAALAMATTVPAIVRKLLVLVGLCFIASGLGASAEAGYRLANAESLANEPAIMVTDAEPSDFGWRAEAQIDLTGQRVRLVGSGFERPDLVAGQPVLVTGRLGPVKGSSWEKSRHLVGVVTGAEVRSVGGMAWFRQPGEWLRSGVLGATDSFSADQAALYHGLVIGDDRFQGDGQRAQFRAAGLSHLLAVSGQNVSFLLAVFAPVTSRSRPSIAFALVVCLLVVFALATRLEPSVLRATVTAGVSTLAALRSARSAGVRSLSLAVILLLLIDPFLAWSVGFQLSVGASVGILLLAPLIRERLMWPGWIAEPVSITLAAQLGVSPVLLLVFGPVASVTIPANLLAGWAAGAVMTLGLSTGLLASVMPSPVAAVLQAPVRGLVWWIDAVAAEAAFAPLPAVSVGSLPWIAVGVILVWLVRPSRLFVAWWLLPLAVLLMMTATRPAQLDGWFSRTGSSPSVLVIDDPSQRWVESVVESRIRSIDVVIVGDGGWTSARTIDRLREVVDIGVVLAPGDHRIVGGRRVLHDQSIQVGMDRIDIAAKPSALEIEVVVGGAVGDG